MSEVNSPQRALRSGSLSEQLAGLEVGGNVTLSRPLAGVNETFEEWAAATKRLLLNHTAPYLARVKARYPERVYEAETGLVITAKNKAHAALIITRLADD